MTTTDKLADALRDFLEEADQGIVATPFTRESARAALAALEAKPADTEFIDGDCVIAWVTEPKRASPAAPAAPAPAGFVLSPVDIYDFAGWLTTRPGKMEVGSSCEAGPMAEAVGEYLRTYPERFQAAPAAPAYITRDTIINGVRVVKVWPEGSDEPQILGTTIGAAPAAPAPWIMLHGAPAAPAPLTDEQAAAIVGNVANLGDGLRIVRATEAAIAASKKGGAA